MIYLDYAANTPVRKEVLESFNKANEKFISNPNSNHKLGLLAKQKIDEETNKIANIIKVKPSEIIYTSGATESNNLVIKGICNKYKNKGKHIITTSLEHSSIIAPLNYMISQDFEVDFVNLNSDGTINLEHLKSLLRNDTILVSICYVDSEVGIIQPIKEISEILKKYPNCVFHTDATQAVGKIEVDFSLADLITFSPHKFHGLNGTGVLIKKDNIELIPIIHGGKSTTKYRAGTPTLSNIVACSKSIALALKDISKNYEYISNLNTKIRNYLLNFDNVIINSPNNSIPYTLNFSIRNIESNKIIKELEKNDIYISSKSACSSDNSISNVVYALKKDKTIAASTLRVSMSYTTIIEEIDEFLECFKKCYEKLTR